MSNDDIPTGARWLHSISSELESSDFGILCLTPENLRAPWINFEAGALSKKVDNSRVVPMLFDLQKRDIKAPLDQFQAAAFDRDGVQSLLKSINNAAGTEGRTESDLEKTFTALWPEFEAVFTTIEPNIHLMTVDITFSLADPQGRKLTYPLKGYVELQNSSMSSIDVRLSEYLPEQVTLKQFVSDVLQVNIAGWCPQPDGVGHLSVLPGQRFRGWVGFDETKFTQEQVKALRGKIGTLVFSINGDALHITI